MAVSGLAPAKINLALHLTGLRADGYHFLESLVVFAEWGDHLTARFANDLSLNVVGPFAKGVPCDASNLVLRAARFLQEQREISAGAVITLEKFLPHGGGIGGGSSDAATILRMLAELWQVDPLTPSEAIALGADLPVCMNTPAPCFMSGVGEIITPAPKLPEFWLLLINPAIAVPTGPVFSEYDKLSHRTTTGLDAMDGVNSSTDFVEWLKRQRNDLTDVVRAGNCAPIIGSVLDQLDGARCCAVARMSGSGATCWGLFLTKAAAEQAKNTIAAANPKWWVRITKIGSQ
jgi:4-diphosphocytidyl-2-C-methyl-D-erythritol kinase